MEMMMNYQEEDSSEHDIPVGFVFKPTDTELLSILKAKILDPTSGGGFVPECNGLYEEEPWRIFGEPDAANYNCRFQEKKKKMENHFYVFTTLKKMGNKSSSKFSRRVGHGGGTWKENNVKDVKNDRGVVVGTVRNFTFVPTCKIAAATGRSSWIMDEFSIPEMSRDYVVCKIKSMTTTSKGGRGENLIITGGSHMISSCIQSSSSPSSSHMLINDHMHMLLLMNGAKLGHETNVDVVDYDDHSSWAGVSNSMISLMPPPNSTVLLPAATLYFNDEPPSGYLPPQRQQVAKGDKVVFDEHMMSLLQPPPLEYYCSSSSRTPPQQQAAAARGAPSSSLDQTLLPSTQQLEVTHSNLFRDDNIPPAAADMMRGHDDQYCLQQPLTEPSNFQQPHVDDHHDKNNRSSCPWEVLEDFVNSTDQDQNHVNNPP